VFWKTQREQLVPWVEIVALPLSLVEAYVHSPEDQNGRGELLGWLSPITIAGDLASEVFR
jgi:hypothetical protein